jgi:hypothetical protein
MNKKSHFSKKDDEIILQKQKTAVFGTNEPDSDGMENVDEPMCDTAVISHKIKVGAGSMMHK